MNEKIYVPKSSLKARTTSFGEVIKFNFHAKTFVEWLRSQKEYINEAGYVSIDILPRKEPGTYGETHNALLDTWKPDASKAKSEPAPKKTTAAKKPAPKVEPTEEIDDVPF